MTNGWDGGRTLLWAGVILLLWREARTHLLPLLRQWVQWKTTVATPLESVALPRDLEMLANNYQDEWAREDQRKVLLTLYAEHRDWDQVRAAYGARG